MNQKARVIHLDLRGICPGQVMSDAIGRLSTWALPSKYNQLTITLLGSYNDSTQSQPHLVAVYFDSKRAEDFRVVAIWKEDRCEYDFRSNIPLNTKGDSHGR